MIKVDPETGRMKIAFQIVLPGIDMDLARAGKGKSHGWMFFTCYNSELAHTLLEVNASQKDKDFIGALEEFTGGGELFVQLLAHTYGLRPLAREHECAIRAYAFAIGNERGRRERARYSRSGSGSAITSRPR